MSEQHILIDPTPEELYEFISNVNNKTKIDGGKLGLIRFVVSKSGKSGYGDATLYYHADIRQFLTYDNDCLVFLEGFITGNRILEVRKQSAEDYFDKAAPTIEDVKASDFFIKYSLVFDNAYFMPALLVN